MAKVTYQDSDVANTLEVQRNEAWNAAARTGAALTAAVRQIDDLEKQLAEVQSENAKLKEGGETSKLREAEA